MKSFKIFPLIAFLIENNLIFNTKSWADATAFNFLSIGWNKFQILKKKKTSNYKVMLK